jgi:hypothetical protein
MKTRKLTIIALFTLFAAFISCDDNDDNNEVILTNTEIPALIKTFVNTHFASIEINRVVKDKSTDKATYKVYLNNNIDLVFNSNVEITNIDGLDELPDSVIPDPILTYIKTNYPNNYITEWELDDNIQEIELDNGLEITFTFNGTSITSITTNNDDDDEVVLSDSEIPATIKSYIQTHFTNNSIVLVLKEVDDNETTYEVYLTNKIELEFDGSFEVISIESSTKLPNSVIPEAILTYVTTNYPSNFITEWELEATYQQVELDNDLELDFTLTGEFITSISPDNGDDNEVILNDSEIPTTIKSYVETHFADNTIILVVKDFEDNITTYEVFLNNKIDLEFNSSFEITSIESSTKLPDSVIPQPILTYVAENYPNNFITDWELETTYQEVELDNDLELEFTLTGDFVRIK